MSTWAQLQHDPWKRCVGADGVDETTHTQLQMLRTTNIIDGMLMAEATLQLRLKRGQGCVVADVGVKAPHPMLQILHKEINEDTNHIQYPSKG